MVQYVDENEGGGAGLIPTTNVQGRVDAYLANRSYMIEKIKPLLIEGVDVYTLPNMTKQSLGKPGAEKLGAFFGLSAGFSVDKETMEAMGREIGGKKYISFVCNLTRNGREAGQGRGAHFIEDMRENYRMVFQDEWNMIKDTLKEGEWKGPLQGTSKSSGKPYTFWKVKDAPVFDRLALNKAIKMAQKSAFVDAIIRTTGTSDLFTQDLEDMKHEAEPEEAAPEHAATTPVASKPKDEPTPVVNSDVTVDDPVKPEATKCEIAGCGGEMKKKNGAKGPFLGCSNFNKGCRNARSV